jgi:hypothetical protein
MKEKRFWQGEKSEKQRKRYLFFEEITQNAYQVNESLRTKVYTPYQSIIPGYYTPRFEELDNLTGEHFRKTHPNSKWSDFEHFHTWGAYLVADEKRYPELIPVREAVIAWSRSNHLDADWCREVAVNTLNDWARTDRKSKHEDDEEQVLYDWDCYPGGGRYHLDPRVEDKLLPLPGFPPYLPFRHESADQYLIEVKRWMQEKIIPQSIWHQLKDSFIGSNSKMRAKLDLYIEEDLNRICEVAGFYGLCVELFYEQKGYKLVNPQPEEAKHIKWAVQAQVCGKSYTEIALEEEVDPSTVTKQASAILKQIGLPPRKGLQPGRKPGMKSEKTRASLGK